MNIQKIVWKINFREGFLSTESLFKFFNTLIDNSPQVYVDIADYQHVPNGPKVLLAGVNADVVYSEDDNSRGLTYNQKEILEGSNQENLQSTFANLFSVYEKMAEFSGFSQPPEIDLNTILFIINEAEENQIKANEVNKQCILSNHVIQRTKMIKI